MTTSNIFWRSISVKYTNASLDFKKGSEPIRVRSKSELSESVEALLRAAGGSDEVSGIVAAMIHGLVVKKFFDHYTSPLLGPKTKRLNFVFPAHIVAPFDTPISCIREEVFAVGKKGVIGGRPVVSNFELDVVIGDVPVDQIQPTLTSHPEWFVGELEYLEGRFVNSKPPTANKKESKIRMV
ncbi:TPA_asm: M [Zea alphacytorhabdovirus 1]|nr:TPA_asm: M [Zea alphacytorhabdovirus 1]